MKSMHRFFHDFTSAIVVAAVATADKGDYINDYDNFVSQIMC